MAIPSFNIDPNSTPEENQMRRALAQMFLKEGMSTAPVGHWTAGLARALQGLMGGIEEGRLAEAEKSEKNQARDLMQGLFGGSSQNTPEGTSLRQNAPASAGLFQNSPIAQSATTQASPGARAQLQSLGVKSPIDVTRLGETGVADRSRMGAINENDTNRSTSYGSLGVNSLRGSALEFKNAYGAQLGLTAQPGTPEFKRQWQAAARDNPDALDAAEQDFYNKKYVASAPGALMSAGVPEDIAQHPSVLAYFGDRAVQYGPHALSDLHSGRVAKAWQASGGDIHGFLSKMTLADRAGLYQDFPSALRSNAYSPSAHDERLRNRLSGSLELGQGEPVRVAQASGGVGPIDNRDDAGHAATAMKLLGNRYTAPLGQAMLQKAMTPETSSDEMKNFKLYRQGEEAAGKTPMTFMDYQLALKRATVAPSSKSESAFSAEMGKQFAKQYEKVQEGAQKAISMLDMYGIAEENLKKAATGKFGDLVQSMREIGARFGMSDIDKVASGQVLRAVGNRVALLMRSGSGGEGGMPGALSDRDLTFLIQSITNLDNTPEGNALLLSVLKKIENRKIEIAALADAYMERNNGVLDSGFNRAVRNFSAQNPLFGNSVLGEGPTPRQDQVTDRVAPTGQSYHGGVTGGPSGPIEADTALQRKDNSANSKITSTRPPNMTGEQLIEQAKKAVIERGIPIDTLKAQLRAWGVNIQ